MSEVCPRKAMLVGILLNLVLPFILKPFATASEIKPPSGAANLDFKGQFMHMMVHHHQVPIMSSLIVALIVGLSILIVKYYFGGCDCGGSGGSGCGGSGCNCGGSGGSGCNCEQK